MLPYGRMRPSWLLAETARKERAGHPLLIRYCGIPSDQLLAGLGLGPRR